MLVKDFKVKIFKCDVCKKEFNEVYSCSMIFGKMAIYDSNPKKKTTLHFNDLCELCFNKALKDIGYSSSEIESCIKETI